MKLQPFSYAFDVHDVVEFAYQVAKQKLTFYIVFPVYHSALLLNCMSYMLLELHELIDRVFSDFQLLEAFQKLVKPFWMSEVVGMKKVVQTGQILVEPSKVFSLNIEQIDL